MATEPRSQIRTFQLDAPRAQVFPLFTARSERVGDPAEEPC